MLKKHVYVLYIYIHMNPIPSGEGTPQNHTPKTLSEGTWPISLSLCVCICIYI